ncbi:MAG: NAD(P)H-dependent oxidoreductase subunit E [Anaeromassilibacillus sp.]
MEKQEITLENILERYKDTAGPGDQQAVIALLREVQQLYGCVPDSVQQRVACRRHTRLPDCSAGAEGHLAAYRHRIVVHRPALLGKGGTASARCGKCPGNCPGETTPDGCFRLETRNCLKQCGSAPNLTVDQTLYASVRVEDIPNLLKRYREPSC